jgi:amino acid transporter
MMLSFVLAALVCGVAALCYAELAAMVPVAGSAVAVGWSGYLTGLLAFPASRKCRHDPCRLPRKRLGIPSATCLSASSPRWVSAPSCIWRLFLYLPLKAQVLFPVWSLVGLICYFSYGVRHSQPRSPRGGCSAPQESLGNS